VINFITVYQVCKTPDGALSKGKCTAAAQQCSLLAQRHKRDPNPIKHFRKYLSTLLKSSKSSGELIVLFGDFNEVFGSDSSGISKLARENDLVDIMHNRHRLPDPATYARGKDRLDYVLISSSTCGYDPFNERVFSDHRGYFVDFDIPMLFGNKLQRLAAQPFSDIRGKDAKCVTKYVEVKDDYLHEHKFYGRIQQLNDLISEDTPMAERLDRDWHRASMTAGKKARNVKKTWWSSTLAKAREQTNLLRTLLGMLKQKRNYRPQLGRLRALHPDVPLPDNIRACSKALRAAQKNKHTVIKDSLKHRENEQLLQMEQTSITGDKQKAKILRNIRKAEEIKRMFNKLRYIRGKYQRSGLATLEFPPSKGRIRRSVPIGSSSNVPKQSWRTFLHKIANILGKLRARLLLSHHTRKRSIFRHPRPHVK
jgi:hypothetical protein